jgi:hypothetical protein
MNKPSGRIRTVHEVVVTTEPQEGGFVLRIESEEIRLAVYLNDACTARSESSPERIKEVVTTFIDIFLASNPGETVEMQD